MYANLGTFQNIILNIYLGGGSMIKLKQLQIVKFHMMFLYFQFITYSLSL
jgi:hypothetical protein